jgi:hypothetical protein
MDPKELRAEFKKINRICFDGKLPDTNVKIEKMRGLAGQLRSTMYRRVRGKRKSIAWPEIAKIRQGLMAVEESSYLNKKERAALNLLLDTHPWPEIYIHPLYAKDGSEDITISLLIHEMVHYWLWFKKKASREVEHSHLFTRTVKKCVAKYRKATGNNKVFAT